MLLGVTPVVALPLAAALSLGLRDPVMRAATGNAPSAVPHRATLARTADGHGGGSRVRRHRRRPAAPPRPAPAQGPAIVVGSTASGPGTVGPAVSWSPSDVPAASATGGTASL
jgi:hypothetical protein